MRSVETHGTAFTSCVENGLSLRARTAHTATATSRSVGAQRSSSRPRGVHGPSRCPGDSAKVEPSGCKRRPQRSVYPGSCVQGRG